MNNLLEIAHREMGIEEIAGPKSHPRILAYAAAAGYTPSDGDGDPWCGSFMAFVASEAGLELPKAPWRANSWLKWGTPVKPQRGAVAIFKRGTNPAQGHVTIIDRVEGEWLYCLGGNQSDSVSIAKFHVKNLKGCRWPPYPVDVAGLDAINARLGDVVAGQVEKPKVPETAAKPVVVTLKKSRTISGVLIATFGTLVTYLGDGLNVLMTTAAQVAEWQPAGGVLGSLGLSPSTIGFVLTAAGLALSLYARIDDATKGRGSDDRPA